ncbi:MAG: hypothetical protein MUE31_14220 [Candidatus Nanopelagicales bacterium]|jgi:hypothetical protein|nr:hypothetical protein [Candidatus Nanopelagicales bacterium]
MGIESGAAKPVQSLGVIADTLMVVQRLLESGRLLSEPLAGEHCDTQALEV